MGSLEASGWAGSLAALRTECYPWLCGSPWLCLPPRRETRKMIFWNLIPIFFNLIPIVLLLKEMVQVTLALFVTDLEEVGEISLSASSGGLLVNHVTRFDVFMKQVDHSHHGLLSLSVVPLGFQRNWTEEVLVEKDECALFSVFYTHI